MHVETHTILRPLLTHVECFTNKVHSARACLSNTSAVLSNALCPRHRRRPPLICPRCHTPSFGFPAFGFGYFSLSSQSSLHRSLTLLICYRSPVAYLALDEVYHPFYARVPTNMTLECADMWRARAAESTGLSPSGAPCSKGLVPTPHTPTARP